MIITPLVGKQVQSFALAEARLNIFDGSVRSSKTITSLLKWLEFVRQAPEGPLLMVGKTERTLRRNIIDPLVEMLGKSRCRLIAGSGELFLLGRRVYIVGANDERSQEKIRGLSLVGAYVDEVSTLPESFFVMLLTRLSIPGARLYATTNPDGPAHWLLVNYLERAATWLDLDGVLHRETADVLNLARFSFQLRDNPNLDPQYVIDISSEFSGLWYRRLILGEWCLAEGVIYESWDTAKHVVHELPQMQRWIALAMDYGTTNPFHALVLGLGVDGRLYVTNEWRWDSKKQHGALTDADYSARLRVWMDGLGIHPEYTVVDPSAKSFRTQMHSEGWTTAAGDNEVNDGIRSVASLFATDRLRVSAECKELIKEIPGYSWDPKQSEKGEDAPIKLADHGVDALRYGIHTTRAIWRGQLRDPLMKAA